MKWLAICPNECTPKRKFEGDGGDLATGSWASGASGEDSERRRDWAREGGGRPCCRISKLHRAPQRQCSPVLGPAPQWAVLGPEWDRSEELGGSARVRGREATGHSSGGEPVNLSMMAFESSVAAAV